MRRLRIAVYHNLRPGGALRALDELLRRSSATHDYDLFETTDAFERRTRAGMGVAPETHCLQHHRLPLPDVPLGALPLGHAHPLRTMWQLDRVETEVAAAIDRGGYDLAFVHPCYFRYSPAILRKLRTPVVFFAQEARRPTFEYWARRRRHEGWRSGTNAATRALMTLSGEVAEPFIVRSDRLAARAPGTYTLCNSVFSAERLLAAYGIQAHPCYLGVDADVFRPSDASDAVRAEPVGGTATVVAVGRLSPTKRHDLVIEAMARLPAETRPGLIVVGERQGGRYETAMQQLAARSGVRLDLLSAASDADLVDAYRSAGATICASELEPFGLTALESIACGTPVVAVREGGFRESVQDGLTGVLVEPSIGGLADGLTRVLADRARFRPEVLHASIGAGGWTWDASVERLHGHYVAALAPR